MFFERNPLPGSDSARHLEPDALILARFGAVRGQISHKTYFSEKIGVNFGAKMFRGQIVRGNFGQASNMEVTVKQIVISGPNKSNCC